MKGHEYPGSVECVSRRCQQRQAAQIPLGMESYSLGSGGLRFKLQLYQHYIFSHRDSQLRTFVSIVGEVDIALARKAAIAAYSCSLQTNCNEYKVVIRGSRIEMLHELGRAAQCRKSRYLSLQRSGGQSHRGICAPGFLSQCPCQG